MAPELSRVPPHGLTARSPMDKSNYFLAMILILAFFGFPGSRTLFIEVALGLKFLCCSGLAASLSLTFLLLSGQ